MITLSQVFPRDDHYYSFPIFVDHLPIVTIMITGIHNISRQIKNAINNRILVYSKCEISFANKIKESKMLTQLHIGQRFFSEVIDSHSIANFTSWNQLLLSQCAWIQGARESHETLAKRIISANLAHSFKTANESRNQKTMELIYHTNVPISFTPCLKFQTSFLLPNFTEVVPGRKRNAINPSIWLAWFLATIWGSQRKPKVPARVQRKLFPHQCRGIWRGGVFSTAFGHDR
jgi:hypothetical protein